MPPRAHKPQVCCLVPRFLQPPAPLQLLTKLGGRRGPLADKSWSQIRLSTLHHYSGAQELQGGLQEGSWPALRTGAARDLSAIDGRQQTLWRAGAVQSQKAQLRLSLLLVLMLLSEQVTFPWALASSLGKGETDLLSRFCHRAPAGQDLSFPERCTDRAWLAGIPSYFSKAACGSLCGSFCPGSQLLSCWTQSFLAPTFQRKVTHLWWLEFWQFPSH